MLAKALHIMLDALELDSSMFSHHSLHCGGAIATYWQGLDQIGIKARHVGEWLFLDLIICDISVLDKFTSCIRPSVGGTGHFGTATSVKGVLNNLPLPLHSTLQGLSPPLPYSKLSYCLLCFGLLMLAFLHNLYCLNTTHYYVLFNNFTCTNIV